jgi:flagellar hook-associated protein 1 FlgK
MPLSTFLGVETALRGLLAAQRELDVTGHNIANANTVGYTRQRVDVAESMPLYDYPNGFIGTGVDVKGYTRLRDALIDGQVRAQTMLQAYHDARSDVLEQVETALGEPSENGVASLLDQFWSSWQDVANNPENLATRQALLQSAAALAGGIRDLRSQLTSIDSQTQENVSLTIGDLNAKVAEIASIDTQIMRFTAAKIAVPNDLLDRRDLLIDDVSKLVNLTKTDLPDGSVKLQVGTFTLLQSGTATTVNDISDFGTNLTSGKLGGLAAAQTKLADYASKLDAVASSLISSLNTAQANGYTLAGTQTTEPFFTGTDASDIAVNANLLADPSLVAASAQAGQPGNGENALAIAALKNLPALDGAYRRLVLTIGADSRDAQRSAANAATLADALSNRRESVIGVSLDEEMTNLVRFQRGYQAAARILTTMDEALETLILRTGRVGL